MDTFLEAARTLSAGSRVLLILILAVIAHGMVLALRRIGVWLVGGEGPEARAFAQRKPKFATVTTLVVSTLTFAIYFAAFGLALGELGISLTAYFASATVIGLAIGFGSQGLVQDVVIGLTLVFSDVLDVGDVADVGGQTGRVESIGLRFTTLRTLLDQRVFVPNRNVAQINRYRHGYVRAWMDVQIPGGADETKLRGIVEEVAQGVAGQHAGIILRPPEVGPVQAASPGGWRYLRIKFHLWPGQGALIETAVRQRLLAAIRAEVPDYSDWMVTVTYRVRAETRPPGAPSPSGAGRRGPEAAGP